MSENKSQSLNKPIFIKANALGNDFIIIKTNLSTNETNQMDMLKTQNIIKMADRKLGIGADQILTIDNEFAIKIWNQDGSTAKMCGNGLRCVAKWIFQESDLFAFNDEIIKLNTVSGEVKLKEAGDEIELSMPFHAKITESDDAYMVNIGNMHKIQIVGNNPPNFSDYADSNYNVSCIWLENGVCNARTWEMGAGETFACGSAAFSIASVLEKLGEKNLDVYFKLGSLKHYKNGNEIVQIGPANLIAKCYFFDEIFA